MQNVVAKVKDMAKGIDPLCILMEKLIIFVR